MMTVEIELMKIFLRNERKVSQIDQLFLERANLDTDDDLGTKRDK